MLLLLLTGVYLLSREAARVTMLETGTQKVVVIDAGHGGEDPGKVGVNRALEKDINLSIARLVEEKLRSENVTVVMTREEDQQLGQADGGSQKAADMRERCRIINESGAVCAVSIHQNSYTEPSASGAQVFYYETSAEAQSFAAIMQRKLAEALDPDNHRECKGNTTYYVLKKTNVPIIIVECGFLSNPEEADLLLTAEYQERVAQAVCEGILEYLGGDGGSAVQPSSSLQHKVQ
ncbi:MAG TPA: N-acetylmuramoyl-L-alanine amidase [Lachnospiraceae bacterium]|nr:N-acetylmuramoyl-L-alanine amidase [Lachnospiraceae bacterium]